MGESSQKPIKVDQNLWKELDSWIKSKQAKKLGYHSKADFATQAIRELLEKYTTGRNIEKEIFYKLERLESDFNAIYRQKLATSHAETESLMKKIEEAKKEGAKKLAAINISKRSHKNKE